MTPVCALSPVRLAGLPSHGGLCPGAGASALSWDDAGRRTAVGCMTGRVYSWTPCGADRVSGAAPSRLRCRRLRPPAGTLPRRGWPRPTPQTAHPGPRRATPAADGAGREGAPRLGGAPLDPEQPASPSQDMSGELPNHTHFGMGLFQRPQPD